MSPDLTALLADPTRAAEVPAEEISTVLGEVVAQEVNLATVKSILVARLAAGSNGTPKPKGRVAAEWLTAAEAAMWLGCSGRTIRRYMHDGTWRKGEHWFQHKGLRPRFKRSALETWLQAQAKPAPAIGL